MILRGEPRKAPVLNRTLPPAALLLTALLLLSTLVPAAQAASPSAEFRSAWKDFHALVKDSKRGKYRSYWQNLERRFSAVYKRAPQASTAPKALYYAARTNEELGKRSFLKSDFRNAVDYYSRVVSRFPRHSWTDDCLYRKAYIEHKYLNQSTKAKADLSRLLREYPGGDMAAQAKELLLAIGGAPPRQPSVPAATVSAPQKTSTVSTKGTKVNSPRPAPRAGQRVLSEIRYRNSVDYTRVVLETSGQASYHYNSLPADPSSGKPHRLYVDIKDTVLGKSIPDEMPVADGILRRLRSGQNRPGVSRVVLDFNQVQKYHVFALENPFRIVIDVSSGGSGTQAASSGSTAAAQRTEKKPSYTVPTKDAIRDADDLIEQLGLTVRTVMIDPGHGGKDPGAIGYRKMREKDVNLRFALILGKTLQNRGFRVLYTRTSDVFVPLEERTAMANVKKADLFVSVHCNAHEKSSMSGFETYYLNLARSAAAKRVAARENAITAKRISDLQFILTDLMLNSKMKESKDLAYAVHKTTLSKIRRNYRITDHGVRTAPFYVLMGAKMPSILVELGYITNSTEAKRFQSRTYLNRKAEAIADGIGAYKKQIERFASL